MIIDIWSKPRMRCDHLAEMSTELLAACGESIKVTSIIFFSGGEKHTFALASASTQALTQTKLVIKDNHAFLK